MVIFHGGLGSNVHKLEFEREDKAREKYRSIMNKKAKVLMHKGHAREQDGDDEILVKQCIDYGLSTDLHDYKLSKEFLDVNVLKRYGINLGQCKNKH